MELNKNKRKKRIVIVSNLYPPFILGGYELRCSLIAKGLKEKGYDISIITSNYGLKEPQKEAEITNGIKIYRILNEYNLTNRSINPLRNLYSISKMTYQDINSFIGLIERIKPDIVNWWNISGLCRSILSIPSQMSIREIYWIEDLWIHLLNIPKNNYLFYSSYLTLYGFKNTKINEYKKNFLIFVLSLISINGINLRKKNYYPTYGCFVSEFLRLIYEDSRLKFNNCSVIHGGVSTKTFYYNRDWNRILSKKNPIHLLYAGAITESRRLHMLINALNLLDEKYSSRFILTIVGKPPLNKNEIYYKQILKLVSTSKQKERITINGYINHEKMPELYKQHDILIFPSVRPEGLPLTIVEAMMSGCGVITSGSGGAGELALLAKLHLFPQDNPIYLKDLLLSLEENRNIIKENAEYSQKFAIEHLNLDNMINKFDKILNNIINNID